MGKFFYSTPDNVVLEDLSLTPTEYRVYNYLKRLADVKTQQTFVKVTTLALAVGRSKRTVQYALKNLHDKGIITRVFRKSESSPKYNISSLFIIHGRHAPCYAGQEQSEPQMQSTACMGENSCIQVQGTCSALEDLEYTIKGRDKTFTTTVVPTTPDTSTEQNDTEDIPEEWQGYEEEAREVANLWKQLQDEQEDDTPKKKPSAREHTRREAYVSPISTPDHPETKTPKPLIRAESTYHSERIEADFSTLAVPEGIPDIMKPTAEYFMFKFGRRSMTSNEAFLLCKLAEIHTPTRINREIDRAAEILSTKPHPLKANSFAYIYRILEHQNSLEATRSGKKSSKRRKNIAQSSSDTLQVQPEVILAAAVPATTPAAPATPATPTIPALSIQVKEAQRVIDEYIPAEKKATQQQQALIEFLERLKQKIIQAESDYYGSLPHDEEGFPIEPDYAPQEELEAAGKITIADYLSAKFPDATDMKLITDKLRHDELRSLKEALEIDSACAFCHSGECCSLPKGCDRTQGRPIATLESDFMGRKSITIRYSTRIRCRHEDEKPKPDPEFERRVKYSGLTANRTSKTFTAYEATEPELIIAKAHAILAVKNGTNIILAGKAGTGKTHLATAIALEVMRAGHQAIAQNLPEMLDEICRAHKEQTDPFGLMIKYKSVPCLVLDDWGKERTSDARLDYLYQIIDYRYRHGLQTIVTTNALDMEGLKNKFNADKIEPLVSRLLENGTWVTIHSAKNRRMRARQDG